MIERIPRRLRVAFTRADASAQTSTDASESAGHQEVDFVAYGEDCVLFGRTVLDDDRLTDMLNAHEEYALIGVTVERFDGGEPLEVDEVVVGRDEVYLVHASGPRGDRGRRHKTAQQHVALKIGRYSVRGFYHAIPGTDPVVAIGRRKTMVPLTNARIQYTIGGQTREVPVETVIVNREQIDWLEAVEPDRSEFPTGPQFLVPDRR
jgi:hypothetical protein